jgi:hypothetical protein
MNTPAFLGSQRKEESHGFHPCHGGEGIVEVDAFPLHETACHQVSLVLDDGTDFIPLQLEHPLKGDCAMTTREISKLLGAVLLNYVHLRLHRGTPCRVSLGLCEGPRLAVVARKMQLRLQVMGCQSRHRLVAEKVLHRTIPQQLTVVVRVDALLVVGSGVANSTGLCSTRAGVRVDVPGGVAVTAGVHGVTDCGGGGEDLIAAVVMAGERGLEVGGGSGTGVDMLGGRELPTPPAPSKWTYSTVKLSYVGVEPSSTALSHAHPRSSSNTTSRIVCTRCVPVSRM